jgi:dihydrofolate synthase/folylpolyglutamate synthase
LDVPLTEGRELRVEAMERDGLLLVHERLGPLQLPLLGRHQAGNVAVALGIVEALAATGAAEVGDDAIRSGLARTRWPGRLELIEHEAVTILLDGAHNPDGMVGLAATIDELVGSLPDGPATVLLGVMRDKEVDQMVRVLAGSTMLREAMCITTSVPDADRALPAQVLASRWDAITGGTAEAVTDADVALQRALVVTRDAGGPLVIAGSLYLVGHLRARLVPGTITDTDA